MRRARTRRRRRSWKGIEVERKNELDESRRDREMEMKRRWKNAEEGYREREGSKESGEGGL